jgi:O-antigen biosynthesis protein
MSTDQKRPPTLRWTGERYVPEVEGNIRLEHVHRYLIARELSSGKRVLDIACGEGYGAAILAPVASSVIGVDIAADAVAHASSKYVRANLEFRQGSCDAIPLPDGSVDVVVSFETLEHLDRQEEFMREIRRVLCRDGLLIISSPDRREYADVLGHRNEFHVRELDRAEFEQSLRTWFHHVTLGGQRIRGGSIVGPLDDSTRTRFLTFASPAADADAVAGLQSPLYLLALASDGPVPQLPVGLVDGGPFAWSSDLPEFLARVQAQCAEDISRRLGGAVDLEGASIEAIRAEYIRQAERVSAQIANLRAELDTYEHSHSWRLTAPLRAARRVVSRARPRTYAVAGGVRRRMKWSFDRGIHRLKELTRLRARPDAAADDNRNTEYVPLNRSTAVETRMQLIAFYLPQFHPIPENDEWWGKGFTEWTNVARGRPQYAGHYQPRLPGELGFYDLRVLDVQRRQIELAKLYGVHAFCYHHYWFAGRRLLRRPLDQLLAHPELDFPFCLCWANENWTRAWDGLQDEVLIAQQHSPEDDLAFIKDIEPALRDRRYVRVDDRLLLIVYRPALLPDARATAERWRAYCREAGIGELFLVSTHAFDRRDPREFGFDAAVEFAPNMMGAEARASDISGINRGFRGVVYDYRKLVATRKDREATSGYAVFRCVTPMWDNEARRPSRGTIFAHSSPALYRQWLEAACQWTERHIEKDKPFVFVNAWNEWAEGAYLEPDQRYGYAYLEATAEALERFPTGTGRPSIVCVSHDAYFHGAQILALNLVKTLATRFNYLVDVILCGPGPLTSEFEAVARVHDFSSPELTREAKAARIQQLYDQGARIAICNTSVVGETVELLKLAGFSVVSLIHELPGLIQSYGLEASIERIARHADKVVFAATLVRDKFIPISGLPRQRAIVQPQGLFAANEHFGRRHSARRELREQLGLGERTRIVLAIGYADHRKGVDLFVDVGILSAAELEDAVFVWVGHHERTAFDDARAKVERAGLKDRFVFPGAVRNSDLFLAGADAYLMTSREDPFPNVVIQALDAGLPVIGFEGAGGFVELLERGCGVLVPLGDTAAMAGALLRLLRSPAETQRLANAGREILAREFSFVNYTRSLVELVRPPGKRVSVVVPNFNYARYLPARLQSIVRQTYPPHEVLFLDDCSSDDSIAIAERVLHASGLSYRILTNEVNQGTYRQWLRGFHEATGELIWIAEADDDCAPNLLERLVARFDSPDVTLAYCESRQIDGNGRQIAPNYHAYTADVSPTKWRADYVRRGVDEIRDTLVVKNTIPNVSAVVMRRGDTSAVEQKLSGLRNAGDWLLYVHLLQHGNIAFVSESLNAHRRHSAGVTIGRGGLNLMREILMVQQYVLERYGISPETERKREANLQFTYEYLGLNRGGPASYKDHEALKVIEWAVTG